MMSRSDAQISLRARGKCVAIVAPHPDDELFGCGLLIARARKAGLRIVIVVLTDGRASHPQSIRWPADRLVRLRQGETRRGLARLGAGGVPLRFMRWHDGRLAVTGSARRLRAVLIGLGADTVLVSSPRDFHPDHRAAFALATRAAAGAGMPVATYEVWSRVDAGLPRARDAGVAQKRWAAAAHRSQVSGYITDDPTAFAFEPHALRALVATREQYRACGAATRRASRPPRIAQRRTIA